jgi:putative ABC transport system permease protein
VVSHRFAQQVGADTKRAEGGSVVTDAGAYTVVGVLPEGFVFPPYVVAPSPDLYYAIKLRPGMPTSSRVLAFARLRRGITLEQARSEVAPLSRQVYRSLSGTAHREIWLADLREEVLGRSRPSNLALLACAGLFTIVAWVNAGQLLIAGFWSRRQEFGIRSAVGAGPVRLFMETAAEILWIAMAGTAAGLAGGALVLHVVFPRLPRTIAPIASAAVDARVVMFCVVLAAAATIALAFLVAPQFRRINARGVLDHGLSSTDSPGGVRVRALLTAVELGSATLLLGAAFAIALGIWRHFGADPGFDLSHVLIASPVFPSGQYARAEDRAEFIAALATELRSRAGVVSVGAVDIAPLSGAMNRLLYAAEGRENAAVEFETRVVAGDYFTALGIALSRGRAFGAAKEVEDDGDVVVSGTVARRLFPGDVGVGQRLVTDSGLRLTVAGVVRDTQDGLGGTPTPIVYRQAGRSALSLRSLVVRSRGDARTLLGLVREAGAAIDPWVVMELRTMREARAHVTALARFAAWLSAFGASLAVGQVMFGIYGVVTLLTQGRRREVAIRMAVGATLSQTRWLIMWPTLGMVIAGVGSAALVIPAAAAVVPAAWMDAPSFLAIASGLSVLVAGALGLATAYLAVRLVATPNVWLMLRE